MLSAYEFARTHIPIEIAKQYTLKDCYQSTYKSRAKNSTPMLN